MFIYLKGFPSSSAGKETARNAGDPNLIPGSGRSPGEGIGYPLQDSWASLMAQLVKNIPVMQETLYADRLFTTVLPRKPIDNIPLNMYIVS